MIFEHCQKFYEFLKLQEMQAKNNNADNEMLHNLRLLRQEMRLFAGNGGEGKRLGDKI